MIPRLNLGNEPPLVRVRPPGPESRSWLVRAVGASAPMGPLRRPKAPSSGIVYSAAEGVNVADVDGNRYVDLAGGFGALLLGHSHPAIVRVLELQSKRLLLALGDVYPSQPKIALSLRLAALYPTPGARVILGQSGADALTAALKTCALATGRPGVLAFGGAYHGLSYAPLAVCGLRESYRAPFAAQLNPHVAFVDYPADADASARSLERVRSELGKGEIGAVLVEPILGRGGIVVPPKSFLSELGTLAREHGALVVADEVWTGLGRAGKWLESPSEDFVPDLICLGKGLGGGMPISACLGRGDAFHAWQRAEEVVHTSTFAGAPLACTAALATLDTLSRTRLCARSADVGARFLVRLRETLEKVPTVVAVRGAGLMIGVELSRPGAAVDAQKALLERGYIVSTGGGRRETIVLTPPLLIEESLLETFVEALRDLLPRERAS